MPSGHPDGCVLAFDYGLTHIGVAAGQTVSRTASPLTTLRARHGKPDWQQLQALVDEWRPLVLIVGLPLNMDDTESDMSTRARAFAARLEALTGLGVELVDERLTSRAVQDATGADSHALAAVLIAESWLNR